MASKTGKMRRTRGPYTGNSADSEHEGVRNQARLVGHLWLALLETGMTASKGH
jgi:hypothetical protein